MRKLRSGFTQLIVNILKIAPKLYLERSPSCSLVRSQAPAPLADGSQAPSLLADTSPEPILLYSHIVLTLGGASTSLCAVASKRPMGDE